MPSELSKDQLETLHSQMLNDTNLMYINLCLLRMMKYNMESMRTNYKQEMKKVIGDAVAYYDNTLTRRMKGILNPAAFEATQAALENEKLVELMDMMPILLDLTPKAMQEYNEVLKLAVATENNNTI